MAGHHLLIVASAGTSAFLVLIGCAVALAVLVALGVALGRGADGGPLATWRHAWREAGFRTGGLWAEFVDWLRTGSRSKAPRDGH